MTRGECREACLKQQGDFMEFRWKIWEGTHKLWRTVVKRSRLLQPCPTLCEPMDHARILEWVTISFSRGSSSPWDQTWVSCIAGRVLIIFWATRDYSTEVQNGEGMKMQGLQEGRVGKMQSTRTLTTASVLHFLPAPIPSLPLFLYVAVGVISELCGSASICSWQFS